MRELTDDRPGAPLLASFTTVLLIPREEIRVATMVVLVETDEPKASLDATTIGELSELGVTNLVLVRDERTIGIVLEGWAFDPAASAGAALSTLAGDGGEVRALYPVGEMAVSAAQRKGVLEQ